MPIFRESGGSFSPVKRLDINDAGPIKRVAAAWINDGGVFKKLFPTEPVDMADSPFFDTNNSFILWDRQNINQEDYWSLRINIPVIDAESFGNFTSSRIIVTRGGIAQPIQLRIFLTVPIEHQNGIVENALSPPMNASTPLTVMWRSSSRWVFIPYDPGIAGSTTNIRIEVAASGTLYFYDTAATLIGF
ncbi:hypothetical protein C5E24_06885 [Pectobacterium parmentieri]|uniref:hypothetical protein n=1 Tax=Pectobacterium parmentieri TaxID=1905730 RepID=UPI000EAC75E0|nr:hypothetical protein [Pectobacterium parmentieri]AYH09435.1 hypothetical protein C5E24_06885 [Pectobacterium parmentieri]